MGELTRERRAADEAEDDKLTPTECTSCHEMIWWETGTKALCDDCRAKAAPAAPAEAMSEERLEEIERHWAAKGGSEQAGKSMFMTTELIAAVRRLWVERDRALALDTATRAVVDAAKKYHTMREARFSETRCGFEIHPAVEALLAAERARDAGLGEGSRPCSGWDDERRSQCGRPADTIAADGDHFCAEHAALHDKEDAGLADTARDGKRPGWLGVDGEGE